VARSEWSHCNNAHIKKIIAIIIMTKSPPVSFLFWLYPGYKRTLGEYNRHLRSLLRSSAVFRSSRNAPSQRSFLRSEPHSFPFLGQSQLSSHNREPVAPNHLSKHSSCFISDSHVHDKRKSRWIDRYSFSSSVVKIPELNLHQKQAIRKRIW